MLPFEIVCPYCHADAELVSGSVVYPHRPDLHQNQFWQCAPCNAYIRCHEGTSLPAGTLANAELRKARIEVHEIFDALWKIEGYTRRSLYALLRERTGVKNLGTADMTDCEKVRKFCVQMQRHRLRDEMPDFGPMLQALAQRNPPPPTKPQQPQKPPQVRVLWANPSAAMKQAEQERIERKREKNRRKRQRKRERERERQQKAQQGGQP